jgi:hypothetical protein
MTRVEEVLRDAESLEPEDRLRLIARLWASLPPDHWAAPSDFQRSEIRLHYGGTDTEPVYDPPWDALRRILNPGPDAEQTKVYHATRRFDLATIFVAMAVYSVLLAGMSLVPEFGSATKIYFGLFIVVIGVGQALLEPYTDPRRASVIVGAGFHTVCSIIYWIAFNDRWLPGSVLVVVVLNGFIGGAIMGYLAGALVGGVYLLADMLRGRFGKPSEEEPAAAPFDDVPLTPVHPLDSVGTQSP